MMAIVQNEDILHWKWKGQREKCSGTQVRIVLRNSTAICVFDHAAQRRRPGDASRRQPDLYHCVISGAAVDGDLRTVHRFSDFWRIRARLAGFFDRSVDAGTGQCTDFRDAKCILGACEEPDCSESDFAWHHFDATMMTIESAFNQIWRVRKPRPLAQRILAYWAALTLGPLLVGASLSISSWLLGQTLAARAVPPLVRWALAGATLPLSALAFTMLYLYLPHHRIRWRDAWIGGALAALAFELLKRGFGLYIRAFPTYAAIYGAFAAVPIFLLWVYLSWL